MCARFRREYARARREIQLLLSQMIVRGRELEIKLVLHGKMGRPSEAEQAGSLNLMIGVSDSCSSYSTVVVRFVGHQE